MALCKWESEEKEHKRYGGWYACHDDAIEDVVCWSLLIDDKISYISHSVKTRKQSSDLGLSIQHIVPQVFPNEMNASESHNFLRVDTSKGKRLWQVQVQLLLRLLERWLHKTHNSSFFGKANHTVPQGQTPSSKRFCSHIFESLNSAFLIFLCVFACKSLSVGLPANIIR